MKTELVKVTVCDKELEAAKEDGKVWVSIRRVCEALGVAEQRQLTKLKTRKWAGVTKMVTTGSDGKRYMTSVISLSAFPMWLSIISPNKVKPEARGTLERFQAEATEVLANHFVGPKKAKKDPYKLTKSHMAQICVRGAEIAQALAGESGRKMQEEFLSLALVKLRSPAREIQTSAIEAKAEVVEVVEPPVELTESAKSELVLSRLTPPLALESRTDLPAPRMPFLGIIRSPQEVAKAFVQADGGLDIPEGNEHDLLSVTETAEFYGLSKQMMGRVVSWIHQKTLIDLRTHGKYVQRLVVSPAKADGAEFEVYSLNHEGRCFFARQLEAYMRENPAAINKLHPEHRPSIFRAARGE